MKFRIAVLGGTGPQGRGLAYRFAADAHDVVIGSRSSSRAKEVAESIRQRISHPARVTSCDNETAARQAEVAVLAVPYEGLLETLSDLGSALSGKPVISCVNPLMFDSHGPQCLVVTEGSAAERAQGLLPRSQVSAAFHHVSASKLWSKRPTLDEDILVCGDNDSKSVAIELTKSLTGRPGIDVGRLRLARELEAFTAVLISLNTRFQSHSGLEVVDLRREAVVTTLER